MLPTSDSVAPARPLVVGVIGDAAALRVAGDLPPVGGPDLLELRADAFVAQLGGGETLSAADDLVARALRALLEAPRRPLILTVRDPGEGGLDPALTDHRRLALLRELSSPGVAWVDLELRALLAPRQPGLREFAVAARAGGNRVIASSHDFQGTPTVRRLRALAMAARESGCVDVFKIATTVSTPGDLARLLAFLDAEKNSFPMGLSVMGMGERFGRASRIALAAAGSVFNYGHLGAASGAMVPGQWPAQRLRDILDEL